MEGKEYISASRASQKSGYSADYIGQLCRAKKIPGKLVGRTWYVDFSSLIEHKRNQKNRRRVEKVGGEILDRDLQTKTLAVSYDQEEFPLFPVLFKNTSKELNKKITWSIPHAFKEAVVVSLFLVLATTSGIFLFQKTEAPFEISRSQSALSLLGGVGEFFGSVASGLNHLKEIALDTFFYNSNPIKVVTTVPAPSPTPKPAPSAQGSGEPKAVTVVNNSLDFSSLKNGLKLELESYIRTQIGTLRPLLTYSTSPSDIVPEIHYHITNQSDSDVDHTSVNLSHITDGGTFINASITNSTFAGPAVNAGALNFTNATGTSATTTNFFSTNGVFSNLNFDNVVANSSSTLQNFTFVNATGTSATTTNFFSTTASSTNLFATAGNIGALTGQTGIMGTLLVNGSSTLQNFTFVNATGTLATTTSLFSTTASSTNLFSTNANLGYLGFGNATGTSATTTNLFSTNFTVGSGSLGSATITNLLVTGSTTLQNFTFVHATGTTATTTNFFSTKGTFDELYVNDYQQNDGTFVINSSVATGDIFAVNDTAVTSGTLIHQSLTANAGNGQVSKGQIIDLVDATVAGGGYSALEINVSGAGVGSGSKTLLTLDPGGSNEVVFDKDGAFRPTTDVSSNTNSIGSASFYWKNGYFDTLTANNLSGTVVTGATSNDTWTIGSTETGDDLKAVIFQRNSGSGNSILSWNSGAGDLRYLSVNYPFNSTYTVSDASIGTAVDLYSGALTNNTTSGTQTLLSLSNTGTGTTENGIIVSNTGTGTTGLEISGTWTNGILTNNNTINTGSGNISSTGTGTLGNLLINASSTLQNFTFINATGTSATTTNLFSTTASSTNLFSSLLTVGGTGLVVDSSRNVGVGTAAPEGQLSFSGAESNGPHIRFQNSAGVTGDAAISTFDDTDGTDLFIGSNAYIDGAANIGQKFNSSEESSALYLDRNGNIRLYTGGTSGAPSQRAVMTSTGLFGIGTTTPWTKLAVEATAGSDSFSIGSSTATHFVVNKSGNVGVGTANPGGHLDISNTSDQLGLRVMGVTGQTSLLMQVLDGAATNRFTVASGGLTVINGDELRVQATSPLLRLQNLAGSTNYATFASDGTDTTIQNLVSGGALQLKTSDSVSRLYVQGTTGNVGIGSTTPWGLLSVNSNAIGAGPQFVVGSSTKTDLIVTNAGNVGVGTTSPWKSFSVTGAVAFPGLETQNVNEDLGVVIKGPGGNLITDSALTINTGDDSVKIGATATHLFIGGSSIRSSGSNDLVLTTAAFNPRGINISGTTGNLTMMVTGGNVGIGTTTPYAKLSIAGGTSGTIIAADAATGFSGILLDLKVASTTKFSVNQSGDLYLAGSTTIQNFTAVNSTTTNATTTNLFSTTASSTNLFAGTVGIGTSAPGASLQVAGSGIWSSNFGFAAGGNAPLALATAAFRTSNDWRLLDDGDFSLNLGGSASYLRIRQSGNISMGADTSPDASLEIIKSGSTDIFMLSNSAEGNGDALVVKNGGNVGIGTTTPSAKLAVLGNAYFGDPSSTGNIRLLGDLNAGSDRIRLSFAGNNGSAERAAIGLDIISGGAGNLTFSTGASNTATERMRIDGSGNVGIGTTTPSFKLDVVGTAGSIDSAGEVSSSQTVGRFANVGSASTNSRLAIISGNTAQSILDLGDANDQDIGAIIYDQTNNILGFRTNNTSDRMVIDSSGNVGIGTTTPNQKLSIFNNGADSAIEFSTISGPTEKWTIGIDDSDGAKFKIASSSALGTNDRLTIDGQGKTAITAGADNDGELSVLTLNHGGNQVNDDVGLLFNPAGNGTAKIVARALGGNDADLDFQVANSGTLSSLLYLDGDGLAGFGTTTPWGLLSVNANAIGTGPQFVIGSSTKTDFIVTNAGNVGIGTTNPNLGSSAAKLRVVGSGGEEIILDDPISPYMAFYVGASRRGYFGYGGDSTNFDIVNEQAGYIRLSTNSAERIRVTSGGNVGIGTTSPYAKLSVEHLSSTGTVIGADSLTGFTGNLLDLKVASTTKFSVNQAGDLYLAGSTTIQNFTAINSTTTNATTTNLFSTTASSTNLFSSLLTVGGTGLIVDSSRNVGIGTTTPGTTLTVTGVSATTPYTTGITQMNVTSDPAKILAFGIDTTSGSNGSGWIQYGKVGVAAAPLLLNPGGGHIGIGTTNPTLSDGTINKAVTITNITSGDSLLALQLQSSRTGDSQEFVSIDGWNQTNKVTSIFFLRDTADNSGALALRTASAGTMAERLRITSAGNVGIGSTTPWGLLSVNANAIGTGPQFVVGSSTKTDLGVTNAGSIGIGTVNPQTKLDIQGTASSTLFYANNGSLSAPAYSFPGSTNSGMYMQTSPANQLAFSSNGIKWLTVDGNGVGIGLPTATNAALRLEIYGVSTTGNVAQKFSSGTSGTGSRLWFTDNANWNYVFGAADNTNGDFVWEAGGQGTVLGTERMRLTQGGSLGIGTTSPSGLLSLAGSSPTVNSKLFLSGIDTVYASSSTSTIPTAVNAFSFATSNSATPLLSLDTTNSRVGIGTASPLSSLSIASASHAVITINGAAGSNSGIDFFNGTTREWFLTTAFSGTAANLHMYPYGGGNMSIGPTVSNPASQLSVTGNMSIGSYVTNAAPTNGLLVSGTVGIGTSTPTWLLNPASATAPQLALSAGAGFAQWAFRNAGGNLYLATTTVAGTATSSNTAMAITSTGSLGIGLADPSGKLVVRGDGSTTGVAFQTQDSSGNVNTTITDVGLLNITRGSAASVTTKGLQIRFDHTANTGHISASQSGVANYPLYLGGDGSGGGNNLYIDAVGNVGIITTSPVTFGTFAVRRAVTGIVGGFGVSGSFSDAANATVSMVTGAGSLGGVFTDQNLVLGAGNAEKMRILSSSGNIGIATTSPYARLSVVGGTSGTLIAADAITGFSGSLLDLKVASTTKFIVNQDNVGIATTSPFGLLSVEQGTETASLWVGNTGSSTPSLVVSGVNGNGGVGIGTTSPTSKLHVFEATTASSSLATFRDDPNGALVEILGISDQNMLIRGGGGDLLNFAGGLSSVPHMTITAAGLVGIGTTSPDRILTVRSDLGGFNILGSYINTSATGIPSLKVGSQSENGNDTGALLLYDNTNDYANLIVAGGTVGEGLVVKRGGNVGIGDTTPTEATLVVGSAGAGNIFATFATANTETLCWDASGASLITDCTSLSKFKENVVDLSLPGLETIMSLTPREYDWIDKEEGIRHDLGFVAEEVEAVSPLLASYSIRENGVELNGVKYERMSALFVKAIQEIAQISGAFRTSLIAWLADAGNGIENIYTKAISAEIVYSKEIHTETLCVKKSDGNEVCITGDELESMLNGQGTAPAPTPAPEPEPSPQPSDEPTAGEAEPQLEPDPESGENGESGNEGEGAGETEPEPEPEQEEPEPEPPVPSEVDSTGSPQVGGEPSPEPAPELPVNP